MIIKINKKESVASAIRYVNRPRSGLFLMPEFDKSPDVSFCITHMNRIAQISETLPVNLTENEFDQKRVEFILVDFSCDKELEKFVLENFHKQMSAGYLKFFRTRALKKCTPLDKSI